MEDIILVGFGGHAKSVADTIEQSGQFHIAGYTDIEPVNYNKYKWLGTDAELERYYKKGVRHVFISVGYMGNCYLRDKLYSIVKKIGYHLPIITDKSAIIANNVNINEGTYVGKGAIINADSYIEKMCIINSGALVEHESFIESYSHIAAGTTVLQGLKIGEKCIVGAGSLVLKNIPKQKIIYGIYKGN